MCGQNQVLQSTMTKNKWLVVMQREEKDVNNGIRLSPIFGTRKAAEDYAQDKRDSDKHDFEIVDVVTRTEHNPYNGL